MTSNGLYLQLFSIHGLLRAENMELGRDADTGRQIRYVVELSKALGQREDVQRVELFTRLISDKAVSEDYAQPIEKIGDKCRIVRIQCGGRKYIRKELLWPHLDEYVDKTIKYIKRQKRIPDIVHGHYPDAGYVATLLSEFFGVPLVYTGHSLGRLKLDRLLNDGLTEKDLIKKYKIDHRIRMEEEILKKADLVVTSTTQEISEQYGQYDNNDIPHFKAIPPGLDIEKFYPFYHDVLPDSAKNETKIYAQASMLEELNRFFKYPDKDVLPDSEKSETKLYAQASVSEELNRFFKYPDKPVILSICRPDKRKNLAGLIKAYGEDLELQTMANLAVFVGIHKDISEMEDNERDVLTEILLLMDKYDLYGKIAIPKRPNFEYEVPELYRLAAEKRGVFVNSALTEPFGITLIEAAACGLPIIAPNNGGPPDIIKNCDCGLLVDTTNTEEIAAAAKQIIADAEKWKRFSKAGIMGIREHYTWDNHASTYLKEIKRTVDNFDTTKMKVAVPSDAIGRRLAKLSYFLITDIDHTLIGDENDQLETLLQLLKQHRDHIGFGVTTDRTIDSAKTCLEKFGVNDPDVIASSVGSEIYYGKSLQYGRGWDSHISALWDREKIVRLLKDFSHLVYRGEDTQRRFKISYNMKPEKDRLAMIHDRLLRNKCRYNLIYSHNKYLDILPYRASKGKAIRYLSYKWEIPLANFLICGNSSNDEEMLRGDPKAVVVGNYSSKLKSLRALRNIYFAKQKYAGGILEAIEHYKYIEKPQSNKS